MSNNKTNLTQIFPELSTDFVEGIWYRYTRPSDDCRGVGYFRKHDTSGLYHYATIGINGSFDIVQSVGWFARYPDMNRGFEDYRVASEEELQDHFREAFNKRGFYPGRTIKYDNRVGKLTDIIKIHKNIVKLGAIENSTGVYFEIDMFDERTIDDEIIARNIDFY